MSDPIVPIDKQARFWAGVAVVAGGVAAGHHALLFFAATATTP